MDVVRLRKVPSPPRLWLAEALGVEGPQVLQPQTSINSGNGGCEFVHALDVCC
jgi:hypothetical protein